MTARPGPARCWHGVIAALVIVSLVVQIVIAVRVDAAGQESVTGTLRGSSLGGRIVRVVSFFTIQSNVLAGLVSLQLALRPDRDGRYWRGLRLAALVGITVTGIVYSTVLAAIHVPHGAAEVLVNTLVHYVVPVLMVLGWLLFGPRPRISAHTVLQSLCFPALWFVYTLVRGAIWHWYPYPFLDVPVHGWVGVLINAVAVTAVLAVVAGLFALGDRYLPRTGPSAEGTRAAS